MSRNSIIVGIICLIVSFFLVRHCMRPGISAIATISSSALYPLLRIQQLIVVPIAQYFEQKKAMHELCDQVEKLCVLNEVLCAENIQLKATQVYAYETDELRNFNDRYALRGGCVAQVLVRHFSLNHHFFLVDAGSSCGIKKDMVAVYCNAIVGKVVEVYPWYCKVCLITDADCKIAVGCGAKGASGIHEGMYNEAQTAVKYVSHLETISIGDMVLSSGEGLIFPKGFALGSIAVAQKEDLFYNVVVKPILNLQTLRYCTLIAKDEIE